MRRKKHQIRGRWRRIYWVAVFALAVSVAAATVSTVSLAAPTTTISVDFDSPTGKLAPKAFSGTISTYGQTAVSTSPEQRQSLSSLGLGFYRVPLRWNGGNIVSSAGGHPSGSGDAWIQGIRALGAEPMIVVGGSVDNNFTPEEAANLVRHFNGPGGQRVAYWVVGNEPGNTGMPMGEYCRLFDASAKAMKAVDPTIKIAGPAWAYFDPRLIEEFIRCAANTVDVIDFHHYAMGQSNVSNDTALDQTDAYGQEVGTVRDLLNRIVPARADAIEIQVGEYNWSWRTANGYPGYKGDDRFYQSVATVWAASVAGNIAVAGGRGHQYADLNGALGMTFENTDEANQHGRRLTDPMPIYHGLRMFSGGDLFRGFGSTAVRATTDVDDLDAFASTNDKNVIVINKSNDTTHHAEIKLVGFGGGSVEVWQTDPLAPFDSPQRVATTNVSNKIDFELPPYTVTTFVLSEKPVGSVPP